MAGEVCARCLWSGPATSAPGGFCPVCGSPVETAPAVSGAGSAIGAPRSVDADHAPSATDALDATDNSFAALTSALSGNGSLDDDGLDSSGSHGGGVSGGAPSPISRGRWALLVVNLALLVLCVALASSTALGWRVGAMGALKTSPTSTSTAPTDAAAGGAPTVATGALLSPTPTVTRTPTTTAGGAPPTPTHQPTAPARPTATPNPTNHPGN